MAYNDVRTPEQHAAVTGNASLDDGDVVYSVGHLGAAQMHGWEAHKRATTEAFTLIEGYYLEAIDAALAGGAPYESALSPYANVASPPAIGPGKHLVTHSALEPWVTFEDIELPGSATQVYDYTVRAYGYRLDAPTTRVNEIVVLRVTRDGSGDASLLTPAEPFADTRLRITVSDDDVTVDVRAHATQDWVWDTEMTRGAVGAASASISLRLPNGDSVAASGLTACPNVASISALALESAYPDETRYVVGNGPWIAVDRANVLPDGDTQIAGVATPYPIGWVKLNAPAQSVLDLERLVVDAISVAARSFWFHPDHGMTVASDEVTAWTDYLTSRLPSHTAINCTDGGAGYRPALTALANGCPALGSNGGNTHAMNLSGTASSAGSHTFCAVVDVADTTGSQFLWVSTGTGDIGFQLATATATNGLSFRNQSNTAVTGAALVTGLATIAWVYDATAGTCDVYYNGEQIAQLTGQTARALSLYSLGGPDSWHGKLASVCWTSEANTRLVSAFHAWAVKRCGVPNWSVAEFYDDLEIDSTDAFRMSYAERHLQANGATKAIIEWACEYGGSDQGEVALYRNGTLHTTCEDTVQGNNRDSVILAGGTQALILRDGPMRGATNYYRNRVQRVKCNATISDVTVAAPSKRLVILGDSIACGYNATNPTSQGWPNLLKTSWTGGRVATHAVGNIGLSHLGSDGAKRAALVAILKEACDGTASNTILIQLGYNDAAAAWSTADFGAAYAALLTLIGTEIPGATVLALSPITASPDTALPPYRAAILAACSGKSHVIYVDGATLTPELADSAHLTVAGNATLAASILSLLP